MARQDQSRQIKSPEMNDTEALKIARHWEAGDIGCGQLIVSLKRELAQMQAGNLLQVKVLDSGAPADLPAWCRMTGHTLVSANPPIYVVRKRRD